MNPNSPKWKFSGYIECRISIIMLCIQKLIKDCWIKVQQIFRSKQRPELLHKKDVFKTFSNSQKSTCVVVSLFKKMHLQFFEKETPRQGFPVSAIFSKILRTPSLQNTCGWLLLKKIRIHFCYVRPQLVESMFMVDMIT